MLQEETDRQIDNARGCNAPIILYPAGDELDVLTAATNGWCSWKSRLFPNRTFARLPPNGAPSAAQLEKLLLRQGRENPWRAGAIERR
jgi:hypothetical protein